MCRSGPWLTSDGVTAPGGSPDGGLERVVPGGRRRVRARRRPGRRRRHLRHRRRPPPEDPTAGHHVRRPGLPRELRRDLVDAPLPGHPLRLRPLHLRLRLEALGRSSDRHRCRDPRLPRRGHRRRGAGPVHPLPPPHRLGIVVEPGQPLDRRGDPDRHRRPVHFHHGLPVDGPGLLPPCPGAHAGLARFRAVRGPGRPPPDVARRPGPGGEGRGGDRFRRHHGHPRAGHRRPVRTRDRPAALTDLLLRRAQRQRAGRHAAPARPARTSGSTRSSAANSCSTAMHSSSCRSTSRSWSGTS